MKPRALAQLILGLLAWRAGAQVNYSREIKPLLTEHCVACHGASRPKAGLRLDTAAAALIGGDSGPAIRPGHSSESLLVRVIEGTDPDIDRMPYRKTPLSVEDVARLRTWIDAGAIAPADETPGVNIHWAFRAVERPPVPTPSGTSIQARHPIDAFVMARLEREELTPSAEADRTTLIRRVHLDITGLPPTPAQVDAFVTNRDPDAYERVVDELLSSRHYGERWARWWLDAARYADSNGYSIDAPRSLWPWRDWVIEALNQDMPFDRFVTEQLAGDLLPEAALAQRVATGFHRNTQINEEGGIDLEQFRIESVLDRVNTTGTVLLGLTVGCAQCHDHKFDPITQREYFQLFAFFNNQDEPSIEVASPEAFADRDAIRARLKPIQEELESRAAELTPHYPAWENALSAETRDALPLEVRNALGQRPEHRSEAQRKLALGNFFKTDPTYQAIAQRLQEAKAGEPRIATTLVLTERAEPRASYVFIKGDFTRRGEDVSPGTPAILHPFFTDRPESKSSPNRLDLARWLVHPANPLTSRVTVNRVWQAYFGRGLVETENDFGTQGTPPTHPELLDWLASEFVRPQFPTNFTFSGSRSTGAGHAEPWSLRHLHRLIVTSATYRQSSQARPDLRDRDPANRLLARQSRLRLDAEIVRDVALTASGRLNPEIGGPSVYPPQPEGVMNLGQSRREWKASTGPERFRRGMYTWLWRATPHPGLSVFDAPDAFSACTRRLRSNTPLQALTLLNDQGFFELAEALAERTIREAPEDGRLDHAFRLCVARSPQPSERSRLLTLLDDERREHGESAAWVSVSRVLLNLDETITRE